MDKDLSDQEVIRNLKNNLEINCNLYAEYKRITEAQLASQNTVIANLIRDKEVLKLLASQNIPLLVRLGEFIEDSENRKEVITKLKNLLGVI